VLLVRTKLDKSLIHGIGLFAADPIRAGTVVWLYQEPFDRKWLPEYVRTLPAVAQEYVFHFCARLRDGTFLVTGDNDRFWNHEQNPNCLTNPTATETVAVKDIRAGEEMTEDYFQYCEQI